MASFVEMEKSLAEWRERWPVPEILRRLLLVAGVVGLFGVLAMMLLSIARGWPWDLMSVLGWVISLVLLLGGIGTNLPGFAMGALAFFSPRRALYGLNALVAMAVAFVLVVMLNYVGARHYVRKDFTSEGQFNLDERTLNLLAKLEAKGSEDGAEVNAYFFAITDPGLKAGMERLLDEYRYRSSRFHYQIYGPTEGRQVEDLFARLGVDRMTFRPNSLIIEYKGETKTILPHQLVQRMQGSPYMKAPPARFVAEDAISSVLRELLEAKKTVCYFVQGHGERGITAGRGNLSRAVEGMRVLNFEVREWNLPEKGHFPPDADILVIADPMKPGFSSGERQSLRTFVASREVGLVVLLEPYVQSGERVKTHIEDVLGDFGLNVHTDKMVFQKQEVLYLGGRGRQVSPMVGSVTWGPHEIVKGLREKKMRAILPMACPIEIVEPRDKDYKAEKLLWALGCWGEANPQRRPVEYDEGEDLKEPLNLVVLAEPRKPTTRKGKVLVIGDCDLISDPNTQEEQINVQQVGWDLFLNAVSYMAGKRENIGIESQEVKARQVNLSPASASVVFWVVVVGVPVVIALFGAVVLLIRRR